MGLGTGTYINSLNSANPLGSDPKSAGDDHIRLLKATLKATFPNLTGAVLPTQTELNYVDGVTSPIQTQLDTLNSGKLATEPTLVALAALDATAGLVEQTGADVFTKRAIGTASGNVPLVGTASDTETVAGLSRRNTTAEAEAGTLDEGHMTPLKTAQAIAELADGAFQNLHVYTESGIWVKPAGLKRIKVTVVGGGGNGAATGAGLTSTAGGGGGGTSIKIIEAGALNETESVTVGGAGGASSFGTVAFCSATGGGHGSGITPGAGGIGSAGSINIKGGGGGGGAYWSDLENTKWPISSGVGGSSHMGGGGQTRPGTAGIGLPGGNYGGGGSGAINTASVTYAGGAGAPGIIIVEEYF